MVSRGTVARVAGLGAALVLLVAPSVRRLAAARLASRVRRRVAPLLAHPRQLEVRVEADRVVLSGPVRPRELDPLLTAVWRIRAVRHVDVRLELDDDPAASPMPADLERGRPRLPAFRLVAVLTAGGVALVVASALVEQLRTRRPG